MTSSQAGSTQYSPMHQKGSLKYIRNNWIGDWDRVVPRRKDNNILFNTF